MANDTSDQPASGKGAIEGTVLDRDGTPTSGAMVAVAGSSAPVLDLAAMTDAQGTFRLSRLPPGPCVVEARKGSASARETAEVVVGRSVRVVLNLTEEG